MYKEIPDGANSIELIYDGETHCEICDYGRYKFGIWANFDTGFNHLLWESKSVREYVFLDELRDETMKACMYYYLNIDFTKDIITWDWDKNSERILKNANT